MKFISFELAPPARQHDRPRFAQAGWSASDPDRWQEVETRYPEIFSNIYRRWVQKP